VTVFSTYLLCYCLGDGGELMEFMGVWIHMFSQTAEEGKRKSCNSEK
jgi:hypothetical protein